MGKLYDIINAEAIAINKKHLNPKNGELKVEEELSKIKSHVDSLKDAAMKKIEAEYEAKTEALPKTIKVRAAKFRLDRFNSDDAETYGEDGIKANLNTLIEKHMKEAEKTSEEKQKKRDEKELKKKENKSKERVAKGKEKIKKNKKTAQKLNDLANGNLKNEAPNDFLLRARTLAQQAEADLEQFENEHKEEYDKEEEKVNEEAKTIGEPQGARDVEKYNKLLDKAAKKIVYVKRQTIEKLNIIKNTLVQKVKLKIMGLLGL